ncbi:hypothetical protein AB0C14_26570 [Microbispora hainanensis]|uniref:hypothetical protein n=1 Tax=Microbispora hainanensis TaxID=568844 RepID=UPI0034045215
MEEIDIELSYVLTPIPWLTSGSEPAAPSREVLNRAVSDQRVALGLIRDIARQSEHGDPLIAKLECLAREKQKIDEEIRLILAYARHFAPNGPYRLRNLATASRMSVSGVRTAFDERTIEIVKMRLPRTVDPP